MTPHEPSPMSFREKSAWISLVAFAVGFLVYFRNVIRVIVGEHPTDPVPELVLLGAMILVTIVLQLTMALRSPNEARTPKDERERLIDLKATRPAFFVLLLSAFFAIGTVHLPLAGRWGEVHLK